MRKLIKKYCLLSVCAAKEITTYQIDTWRELHFYPSGPFIFAAQQARNILWAYPGIERVTVYWLDNWNGKTPKYLVENWIRSYRFGNYEQLENHVRGKWVFTRERKKDVKETSN